MKISFITTIFNEEKTIKKLLDSLLLQTITPSDVIIVDGGSSDATLEIVKSYKSKFTKKKIDFSLIIKKGNRSIGRNEAIKNATGDVIVCSDSGNILDKNWIKNISSQFKDKSADVVAGYYKAKVSNIFQKCLVPYVLVMPDKVDPNNFLPATRSMALKKSIWKKVGGFPEEFSHNEDYVFANQLKDIKAKMVFAKVAIVYWIPRTTFKQSFIMFFRFALGDAEAVIMRTNVLLLFARYGIGLYLLGLSFLYQSVLLFSGLVVGFLGYLLWAINKNYRYVSDKRAMMVLPTLQLTADAAVLSGTFLGLLKRAIFFPFISFFKTNILVIVIIGIYVLVILSTIQWGIPNNSHPFTYQMDEWHQLQAVRTTFTQGSPNVEGSANGSMLHFILAGIYLIPFVVFGMLNPFAISSSVTNLDVQQTLFIILRLNTLFYGVAAIGLLGFIGKKYFRLSPALVTAFFTFTPMWLSFSTYFKYDIALIFWIELGFLFLLRFLVQPTTRNIILATIITSLSFAVKLSAFPLLPALVVSVFLAFSQPFRQIKKLFISILVYFGIFALFGIPDLLFSKGNMFEYLDANLRRTPGETDNFILGSNYLVYLFWQLYPYHFGHVLYVLFGISGVGALFQLLKKKSETIGDFLKKHKEVVLLWIIIILFFLSLFPLKIEARTNRMLVLLPFIVLVVSLFIKSVYFRLSTVLGKRIYILFIIVILCFQFVESFGWTWVKIAPDPRAISSIWIEKHIKKGEIIGIENIPIYQFLPDIIVKEFYQKQYRIPVHNDYRYEIINKSSKNLPSIVVISNAAIASDYLVSSDKKVLVALLIKEHYQKRAEFVPDFKLYSFYGNSFIFYMSNLVSSPTTITIFSK